MVCSSLLSSPATKLEFLARERFPDTRTLFGYSRFLKLCGVELVHQPSRADEKGVDSCICSWWFETKVFERTPLWSTHLWWFCFMSSGRS